MKVRATIRFLPLLLFVTLGAGCAQTAVAEPVLRQTSTIQALLDGVYDADLRVDKLVRPGDIGLGTFQALDGEMVVVDGEVYQVRADGSVRRVPGDTLTPFAAVVSQEGMATAPVEQASSLEQIGQRLDALRKTNRVPYGMRVDGEFEFIRTRSVAPQHKEPRTSEFSSKPSTIPPTTQRGK